MVVAGEPCAGIMSSFVENKLHWFSICKVFKHVFDQTFNFCQDFISNLIRKIEFTSIFILMYDNV